MMPRIRTYRISDDYGTPRHSAQRFRSLRQARNALLANARELIEEGTDPRSASSAVWHAWRVHRFAMLHLRALRTRRAAR